MRKLLGVFLILLITAPVVVGQSFKADQKRYRRVREAYAEKDTVLQANLDRLNIERSELEIYIQAYKLDRKLEVYGKNKKDTAFQLLKDIDICALSGNLGPKRMQGDLQIPEGFYNIIIFNPASNFHLSLGLDYPNKSDKILGVKGSLGGDIYIHGDCVTIGCLPLTDDVIKEVYLYCVEARNNGQSKIPVTIYPARLEEETFSQFGVAYAARPKILALWKDLKAGYDIFEQYKRIPKVKFLSDGRHEIK
ncbi:MAG: hypothetical protein MK078_01965 [Crocinitomicaceae bacterium]|nr:hypothetical protein [Crocinitomicaceae bacterium]